MVYIRRSVWLGLALCMMVLGCHRSDVTVEQRTASGWQPLPYRLASVESRRDGYVTEARFGLVDNAGVVLHLVLRVAVDPVARLEKGSWSRTAGAESEAGEVMPIQVEFLGGQGSGASVGGRFLLQADGGARYRVTLPPTAPAPEYR